MGNKNLPTRADLGGGNVGGAGDESERGTSRPLGQITPTHTSRRTLYVHSTFHDCADILNGGILQQSSVKD